MILAIPADHHYAAFCWDEAVALAGSAADNKRAEEAHQSYLATMEPNGQAHNKMPGSVIPGISQPAQGNTSGGFRSAGLQPGSDGANIYPTETGLVIAGSVPFIGNG